MQLLICHHLPARVAMHTVGCTGVCGQKKTWPTDINQIDQMKEINQISEIKEVNEINQGEQLDHMTSSRPST